MNAFKPLWSKRKKKSQFAFKKQKRIYINSFLHWNFFSNFYICFRFYLLICRAGTTVSLLHLMLVVHAEWIVCDRLLHFNNWSKQMEIFTLRPNKRWWMRTSVEMKVKCAFLGHSKVLNNPWEYDEKQASCSMEIHVFPKREDEALSEV